MGQKQSQSYSLTSDSNNEEAVQDEVAQTFNDREPTPLSLRPMSSVKTPSNINKTTENNNEVSSTVDSCLQNTIPVEDLYIEPEFPHCIFVPDKENTDPSKEVNAYFLQPDGFLKRQAELSELPEADVVTKTTTAFKAIHIHPSTAELVMSHISHVEVECEKLGFCKDELIPEPFEVEEEPTSVQQHRLLPSNAEELLLSKVPELNE